jgi:mannan endo-1,4-beta-mannosidase
MVLLNLGDGAKPPYGPLLRGIACRWQLSNDIVKMSWCWGLGVATLIAVAACSPSQVTTQADAKATDSPSGITPPVVSLSTSANSIGMGRSVTLKWSAAGAQSCMASGGWSGAQPTSGSQNTTDLTTTTKFTLTCVGNGGSASQTATVTVAAVPPSTNLPTVSLSAGVASLASGASTTLTWASTNATACTASGGWSGALMTAGSESTEAVNASTTYTLTCTGSGGSAVQSVTVSVTSGAPTGGTVSRPPYNTGDGFFVLNGKLYDANGNEFRMRGVDRAHYDSHSQPGISHAGANAVRMFMYTINGSGPNASTYMNVANNQHIAYSEVPIIAMPVFPDGVNTSGNNSATELSAGVAWWVANAATFTPYNRYIIINIANEWGPANSTVWRDAYISVIPKLRAAGYLGTLLIDSGGAGQDLNDLLTYSTAVFNSDPQKNVMFALHVYNLYNDEAKLNTDLSKLTALSQSAGMSFSVPEFGPGRGIGVSSALTPGQIITTIEANGLGWLAWAWDDNDLSNAKSDDNWFSMTYNDGVYMQPSDLTIYGQDVVLNPTYGITKLARPATIF